MFCVIVSDQMQYDDSVIYAVAYVHVGCSCKTIRLIWVQLHIVQKVGDKAIGIGRTQEMKGGLFAL